MSQPQVIQLLAESFYTDNFLGGAKDVGGGYKIWRVMKERVFNLRKWHSNNVVLQEKISFNCTNERCKPVIANIAIKDNDGMAEPKKTRPDCLFKGIASY